MRYLLDTNICIYILKNYPPQVKEQFLKHQKDEILLSSITIAELLLGACKSPKKESMQVVKMFIENFEILNFDEGSANEYAKIRAKLELKGEVIGNMDMLIAAIAKANGCVLVTNNAKEFKRVDGLVIENWI